MTLKNIIIENNSGYEADELFDILPRENNNKRKFLIVNKLQGKHVPVSPSIALAYFDKLGEKVACICKNERVLVIGFAETATAIGTVVAGKIQNSFLAVTTREVLPSKFSMVKFEEEHSHAINQELFLNIDCKELLKFDRIVFVEDEISTGRTILNFIKELKAIRAFKSDIKFTIASLICGLVDKAQFKELNVDFCYLTLIDNSTVFADTFDYPLLSNYYKASDCCTDYNTVVINGLPNVRFGIEYSIYEAYLNQFISNCLLKFDFCNMDVLVVGTEEFMHPAIRLATEIEKTAKKVKTHSTTRSPIKVGDNCTLSTRYEFKSVYNKDRITYLYNLDSYDIVLIVTDADEDCHELLSCLIMIGNNNINIVRWSL